ncbi:MAG: anti-sigma factor family protein, partial [Bacteroidales bacterium]
LFQKYIDHECTDAEINEIKHHLLLCDACKQKLDEREKLSAAIKRAVNSLNRQDIARLKGMDSTGGQEIPVFTNRNARLKNKNIKLLIYSLSAACILLFVLFIVDKEVTPHQNEITIVQSVTEEVDANRPASDQEFVIEVYDGKGQRLEYFVK